MTKVNLPGYSVVLNSRNPETQEIAIATMKALGVPVYEGVEGFDPSFPYVYWENFSEQISQTTSLNKDVVCSTVEEFLSFFVKADTRTIKLTDEYTAKIFKDKVEVGCQTVSFEKIEEVYKTMVKLRK